VCSSYSLSACSDRDWSGEGEQVWCSHVLSVFGDLGADELLNDRKRDNEVEDPDWVLTPAGVHAQVVAEGNLWPEVPWEALGHAGEGEDEGDNVPDHVGVPADKALSEECHEEGGGLNGNQTVETKVHQAGGGQDA